MSSCIDGIHLHPQSVQDAAIVLDTLTERFLRAEDPRGAFSDVYGIVTRAVAAEVESEDGMFLEPTWITRLAGRFCERYLETLRWNEAGVAQDCGAWHTAYACVASPLALPTRNALLGFSAHINHDLAFGIEATIRELGHEGDARVLARYKHDHDQVNRILLRSVATALDHLGARHGCSVSRFFHRHAPGVAIRVAMALLTRWREQVWTDVIALLGAPTTARRAEIALTISRRSARITHALALPARRFGSEVNLKLSHREAS